MKIKFLIFMFTAIHAYGKEMAVVSQDPEKGTFWCSAGGQIADFRDLDSVTAFLKAHGAEKIDVRSKGFTSKSEALRLIEKFTDEGLWIVWYFIPVKITVHVDLPYRFSSSSNTVSVVSENEINEKNLIKAHNAYLKQKLKERDSRAKDELTSRWSQFLSRSALQS